MSPAGERRGKTIAVIGARGGTGATTLATNVAMALAHYSQGKTALLDLNLGRTITDQLLELPSDQGASVADLLPTLAELAGEPASPEILAQAEAPHPSGLTVIVASRDSEPVSMSGDAVVQLLGGLSGTKDIVVLDLPSTYDEATFAALGAADRVVIVATPDVPTLKRTKALLQRVRTAKDDPASVKVVLNRANEGGELNLQQIEDFLGEPAWSVLPASAEVGKFHNRRIAPVLDLAGPYGKAAYLTAYKLHPMKPLAKPKR